MVIGPNGIKESSQFLARIDVRSKGFQGFWNCRRQWRVADIAARDRKSIEACEHFMLAMPETGDGSSSGEPCLHTAWCDLVQCNLAHRAAKGLKSAGLGAKAHADRLFVSNVAGSHLGELAHDISSLKSKFATSRRPAKSTFAWMRVAWALR